MINSNILITGGTGFVGSHLVEKIAASGKNVVTTFQTVNPKSYFFTKKLDKKVTMVNADICDFEKIFDIVTKFKIDYIFHLAAQPLVEVAYNNPKRTLNSNILGTINICESARLFNNIKAIIVASSDKAYGKLEAKSKYLETDPLKGTHPYEVSKSAADLIAYSYFKTYKIPVVTTRFGNIYGEGDLNFSRIIPGLMEAIIKKEDMIIRSNGKYIRDYLYVKDVVDGYLLLAENIKKTQGEAFNFGSDDTLSVLELINLVAKKLKKRVNYKIVNTAINEIPYQSLDSAKIKKIINWKQKYTISKTISKIYNWYNKNL